MLILKTNKMELRGIVTKTSQKTQKNYYLIYCEDGESILQHQFVCKDIKVLPEGLKKGDHVVLTLNYNNYKEFDVLKVEKVG